MKMATHSILGCLHTPWSATSLNDWKQAILVFHVPLQEHLHQKNKQIAAFKLKAEIISPESIKKM